MKASSWKAKVRPWHIAVPGLLAGGATTALAGKAMVKNLKEQAQPFYEDPNSQRTFRHLLGAGLLTGGGLAGLHALVEHLKLLKSQADTEKARDAALSAEPDPLLSKEAAGPGWNATALGLLSAILGGAASYAGVNAGYKKLREQELRKMLQDAEQGHTEALLKEHEAAKMASGSPIRLREWIVPLMLASLPATALASAIGVHRLMKRTLEDEDPTTSKPTPLTDDQMPAVLLERKEASAKHAGWITDDDELSLAMLGVARHEKGAAELRDLVSAVAHGYLPAMEKIAAAQGYEALAQAVRGAGEDMPEDHAKVATAELLLVKSAALRKGLDLLVAAEINNTAPGVVKIAGSLSPDTQETLCAVFSKCAAMGRIAALGLGEQLFVDGDTIKCAATADAQLQQADPAALLQQLLQGAMIADDAQDLPQVVGDAGEDSDPDAVTAESATAASPKDPVDMALVA